MNFLSLLLVPWRSSPLVNRGMAATLFVLCSVGATAVAVFDGWPDRWLWFIGLYGAGLFILNVFLLSTLVCVAIDARQLCVPGAQRQTLLSLVCYFVMGIAPPILVLAIAGQMAWQGAVAVALLSACGLALSWAPLYLTVVVSVVPGLLRTTWNLPRFEYWGAPALLLVLLFNAVRWRQLVWGSHANQLRGGWSMATVMGWRGRDPWGWNMHSTTPWQRQLPDWLSVDASLGDAGPGEPGKALRIALGGWYLPQTTASYAKQMLLIICSGTLPLTAGKWINQADHRSSLVILLEGVLRGLIVGLVVIAGPLAYSIATRALRRRWRRVTAELPLLALLPGLGNALNIKKRLLLAALVRPLVIQALSAMVIGIGMLCWPAFHSPLLFALLLQLASAVITISFVLNLFSGNSGQLWVFKGLYVIFLILAVVGVALAPIADHRYSVPMAGKLMPLVVLAFLVLGVAACWLARNGWRDLIRRPHPFLPC